MKICFVPLNSSSPWGGSELLWAQLANLCHNKGIEVMVVIRDWKPMPPQILALESLGITISRYSTRRPFLSRLASKVRNASRVYSILRPLVDIVRSFDPDLIIFSADGMVGLSGIQLAAILDIPYAYLMQCASESFWPSDQVRCEMNAAIDKATGVFCFVSERNREVTELQLGRPLPGSLIVRNPHAALGIDPLPWPAPQSNNTSDIHPELKFAFVGRQEPVAKGQDIIFRILSSSRWMERSWSLKLYGQGSSSGGVIEMARMLGISSRLHFYSTYKTIVDVWRDSHVLLMASRYEGLPLALVEAMSLGRPAVVTDVADCALLLRDGIDGFVAEHPSISSYALAMERLWISRFELPQMGTNAWQRVRDFLPSDPVQDTLDKILSNFSG